MLRLVVVSCSSLVRTILPNPCVVSAGSRFDVGAYFQKSLFSLCFMYDSDVVDADRRQSLWDGALYRFL